MELIRVSTGISKPALSKESTDASSSDEFSRENGPVSKGQTAEPRLINGKIDWRDRNRTSSPEKPSTTHLRSVSEAQLVGHDNSPNEFV